MTASSSDQVRSNPVQAPVNDTPSLDSVKQSSSSRFPHSQRRSSHSPPTHPERTIGASKLAPEVATGRVPVLREDVGEDFIEDSAEDSGDETDYEMTVTRPPLYREGQSNVPLLKGENRGRQPNDTASDGEDRRRPSSPTRRSTFRSRTPDYDAKSATRRKYTFAAFFLILSLISFTVQTETAIYIQQELGWNKPYCML